jgi:hypothetical protein
MTPGYMNTHVRKFWFSIIRWNVHRYYTTSPKARNHVVAFRAFVQFVAETQKLCPYRRSFDLQSSSNRCMTPPLTISEPVLVRLLPPYNVRPQHFVWIVDISSRCSVGTLALVDDPEKLSVSVSAEPVFSFSTPVMRLYMRSGVVPQGTMKEGSFPMRMFAVRKARYLRKAPRRSHQ